MFSSNLVVLRGRLSSDPTVRQLPSGTTVTQIELTTSCDGAAISVPVVVESREVTARAGAEVVVIGHVRRRFFRAGGVTQSRTEVVASEMHSVRRRRAIDQALERVRELTLEEPVR
jgi:single-strand DNA-binding protein